MNYYQLRAELKSPLLVQANRQSNAPQGLDYLPGASLRGAVAGHYLRCGGDPSDEKFVKIFLEGPVSFPDLLPVNQPDHTSRPLPMTACSCKRTSGFLKENKHGVGDALASLLAERLENQPLSKPFECKKCQQEMKPFEGFWNGNPSKPEKAETVQVYQRHTGIDRHTGTVASSIFYITGGIAEARKDSNGNYLPQFLSGGIYLTEDQFETLSDWFSETIFAGADRTRGMGEMAVDLKKQTPPEFDLESWDHAFRKKLKALTSKPLSAGLYFSIGIEGHAILLDQFLRPTFELPIDFSDIEPVLRNIRQHTIRGWQSSWGLPKPEDKAVRMGGVYLYQYKGEDVDGLKNYLKQLTIQGIGLRRAEGFGRLRVCDPLHVEEVI